MTSFPRPQHVSFATPLVEETNVEETNLEYQVTPQEEHIIRQTQHIIALEEENNFMRQKMSQFIELNSNKYDIEKDTYML